MIPEKELAINVGDTLRKLRVEQGLTLRELAFRCDMESSNIARIESGRRSVQLFTFIRLCEGLNITPSDFLKKLSF